MPGIHQGRNRRPAARTRYSDSGARVDSSSGPMAHDRPAGAPAPRTKARSGAMRLEATAKRLPLDESRVGPEPTRLSLRLQDSARRGGNLCGRRMLQADVAE